MSIRSASPCLCTFHRCREYDLVVSRSRVCVRCYHACAIYTVCLLPYHTWVSRYIPVCCLIPVNTTRVFYGTSVYYLTACVLHGIPAVYSCYRFVPPYAYRGNSYYGISSLPPQAAALVCPRHRHRKVGPRTKPELLYTTHSINSSKLHCIKRGQREALPTLQHVGQYIYVCVGYVYMHSNNVNILSYIVCTAHWCHTRDCLHCCYCCCEV